MSVPKPWIIFLGAGLFAFFIYVNTLAPTITWRNSGVDSGDLATAVAVGGIPHPPGYPTYLLLGELFKRLPFGDIAYRLNLLSATCAALTVTVMGGVIHRTLLTSIGQKHLLDEEDQKPKPFIRFCAASASLTLAFSSTFWSQAVIGEVYALNALFASLLLYITVHLWPPHEKWLAPGLFGLMGLSLGNHLSILFFMPALIGLTKARWQWQRIVAALLAFCIGLSVYAIIPLRAATLPPINWGLATTWPNFLWLVSGEPYRQFLFSLPWAFVPTRIMAALRLLAESFMGWGIPVGLVGFYHFRQANRLFAYASLVAFFVILIYAIGYNTTDSYVYLLPALLIFALWLGWGLYEFSHTLPPFWLSKYLTGAALLLLPLLSLFLNYSAQDLTQDYEAYMYARHSLQSVAPEAVIITDSDSRTFALWYGRYALKLRSDVAIVNTNLLPYAWYRQTLRQAHPDLTLFDQHRQPVATLPTLVAYNFSKKPIYLATLQLPKLDGYHLETLDNLQAVRKSPN